MTNASGKHALILGLGYTGRAVAERLLAAGWRVSATGRTTPDMAGVRGLVFEGDVSEALRREVAGCDLLVSSVPPRQDGGDPVIDALGTEIAAADIAHVIYLSATSVYGDRGGQWVFEDEPVRPGTRRGRARAEAELAWLESGANVQVLRLAGIYGPARYGVGDGYVGRNAFAKMGRAVIKPDHVVNRIHVEDIAGLVLRVTESGMSGPGIFHVADGHPAPPQYVVRRAAEMAGVPAPTNVPWTDPSLSDMARSFYSETKRIDISKVCAAFDWAPTHTDYQVGLDAIWAEDRVAISEYWRVSGR